MYNCNKCNVNFEDIERFCIKSCRNCHVENIGFTPSLKKVSEISSKMIDSANLTRNEALDDVNTFLDSRKIKTN